MFRVMFQEGERNKLTQLDWKVTLTEAWRGHSNGALGASQATSICSSSMGYVIGEHRCVKEAAFIALLPKLRRQNTYGRDAGNVSAANPC